MVVVRGYAGLGIMQMIARRVVMRDVREEVGIGREGMVGKTGA